jgi:cell division protein FtsX
MAAGASKAQISDVRAALRRSDVVRHFAFGTAPDAEVYMKVDASPEQIAAVQVALVNDPAVAQLRRVSQQEVFSQITCLFADRPDLLEATSAEALPPSFRLELKPGADRATLKDRYATVGGVDEVVSNRGPLGP